MSPLISVVIPTFNRELLLERAVYSVTNQTIKSIEIIIIDDNSSDGTFKSMKEFQKKDQRIKYIRLDENKGGGVARNIGIDNANGEYIAFLDDDDIWLPLKLERQLPYVDKYSYVGCKTRVIDGSYTDKNLIQYYYDIDIQKANDESSNVTSVDLNTIFKNHGQMAPSTIICKTKYIRKIGGFDESLPGAQGRDLFVRLIKNFGNAGRINEFLTRHYKNHGYSRISTSSRHIRGMWAEYNKHKHLMPLSLRRQRLHKLYYKEYKLADKIPYKLRWGLLTIFYINLFSIKMFLRSVIYKIYKTIERKLPMINRLNL